MCDYSLEMYVSRPARESEKYVTTRFPSGSIGLTAPGDCTTAVCVMYDTRLTLENLSSEIQASLGVKPIENVTFARQESGPYRDGIRFANGRELSLQRLGVGVTVSLAPTEKIAEQVKKLEEQAKTAEPAKVEQRARIFARMD
jgi:hypothetical protein